MSNNLEQAYLRARKQRLAEVNEERQVLSYQADVAPPVTRKGKILTLKAPQHHGPPLPELRSTKACSGWSVMGWIILGAVIGMILLGVVGFIYRDIIIELVSRIIAQIKERL